MSAIRTTRMFLRRISPLINADRITRPVLIAHGKNDRRVPIGAVGPARATGCARAIRRSGISRRTDEGEQFRPTGRTARRTTARSRSS